MRPFFQLVGDPAAQQNFDEIQRKWPSDTFVGNQAVARKPGSAADAFGVQFQFVAEKDGNNSLDGLSWGSAKKEIQAALDALPNGGLVMVAPGSYNPTATGDLDLSGHAIVNAAAPMGGGGSNTKVTINHSYNGDLVRFVNGGSGTGGGGLHGIYLNQTGNFTGAALKATSTTAARVGGIYVENCTIGGGTHGFERDVDFDGSGDATAGGPGLRQVFFTNVQMFGCKTAGETVRLNRVIHAFFTGCNIIQAPEGAITQGLKILHADSDDIQWNGYILGNVSVAAAGNNAFYISGPGIAGNLTYETGSANCRADVHVTGLRTNNGSASSNQLPFDNNTFPQPVSFDSEILPNRIRLVERTDIGNTPANSAAFFAMDVGGKTAIMARFPSGAAVQIAIEP